VYLFPWKLILHIPIETGIYFSVARRILDGARIWFFLAGNIKVDTSLSSQDACELIPHSISKAKYHKLDMKNFLLRFAYNRSGVDFGRAFPRGGFNLEAVPSTSRLDFLLLRSLALGNDKITCCGSTEHSSSTSQQRKRNVRGLGGLLCNYARSLRYGENFLQIFKALELAILRSRSSRSPSSVSAHEISLDFSHRAVLQPVANKFS
jgi:hypothetical protein